MIYFILNVHIHSLHWLMKLLFNWRIARPLFFILVQLLLFFVILSLSSCSQFHTQFLWQNPTRKNQFGWGETKTARSDVRFIVIKVIICKFMNLLTLNLLKRLNSHLFRWTSLENEVLFFVEQNFFIRVLIANASTFLELDSIVKIHTLES